MKKLRADLEADLELQPKALTAHKDLVQSVVEAVRLQQVQQPVFALL